MADKTVVRRIAFAGFQIELNLPCDVRRLAGVAILTKDGFQHHDDEGREVAAMLTPSEIEEFKAALDVLAKAMKQRPRSELPTPAYGSLTVIPQPQRKRRATG